MEFNVLREKWIPLSDGHLHSLMETLDNADRLGELASVSRLENCAIYRLLVAFCMDALQLKNKDERHAYFAKGRFDQETMARYVAQCGENSFDLFDKNRPFMQSRFLAKNQNKIYKPVADMVMELPSGHTSVFFDHRMENQHVLSPDEALRAMLALYMFCASDGRGYAPSLNGTPCVYTFCLGNNLFETLVLNMLSIRECGNTDYGKPAWCQDEEESIIKQVKVDMLQALTWRPRRILLICRECGDISQICLEPGMRFENNDSWHDPNVSYKIVDKNDKGMHSKGIKRSDLPIRPEVGRALWRDIDCLAASGQKQSAIIPAVVSNLPGSRKDVKLLMTGLVTTAGKATKITVQHEEINLPADIPADPTKGGKLHEDMELIENCGSRLKESILLRDLIADGNIDGNKLAFKTKIKMNADQTAAAALLNFFLAMREKMFNSYLPRLSACKQDTDWINLRLDIDQWVEETLRDTLDHDLERIGYSGDNLRKQALVIDRVMGFFYTRKKEREGNINEEYKRSRKKHREDAADKVE